MPQNFSDLGLSSDKILSVTRTSGDGAAGSLDTYTIKTRANPNGTGFTFTVQNGRNGASSNVDSYDVEDTVTSLSDLVTYIGSEYADIGFDSVDAVYEHLIGIYLVLRRTVQPSGVRLTNTYELITHVIKSVAGAATTSYELSCGVYDDDSQTVVDADTFITEAAYSSMHFALLLARDEETMQLDTEVSGTSTNAVENQAIGKAVGTGVKFYYASSASPTTPASLPNAGQNYLSDFNDILSYGLPFYDDNGARHPVYRYAGHAVENIDQNHPSATADCQQYLCVTLDQYSDSLLIQAVTFDTTANKIRRKVDFSQATNAEIDALFPEE